MQERPNVFISATSADLGSYRRAVRAVLLEQGVYPMVQDHFEHDHQKLLDILRQQIDACDAVICLVGFAYGQEPKNRPASAPRRSYTQLECEIAEAFDKLVYVFLADAANMPPTISAIQHLAANASWLILRRARRFERPVH